MKRKIFYTLTLNPTQPLPLTLVLPLPLLCTTAYASSPLLVTGILPCLVSTHYMLCLRITNKQDVNTTDVLSHLNMLSCLMQAV